MATAIADAPSSLFTPSDARLAYKDRDAVIAAIRSGELTDAAEIGREMARFSPTKVAAQFDSPDDFLILADNVKLVGDGIAVTLKPKAFKTGSYGWSFTGKLAVTLPDGKAVRCQGSVNLVAIGSKPTE
jgi:hypothetical protein